MDAAEVVVDLPLQGRVSPVAGKTVRFFGSIFNPASPAGYLAPVRALAEWQANVGADRCCGAFAIQCSVVEIIRSTEEGAPVGPVPNNIFSDPNNLPAGMQRARGRSQVKLRINAELNTIGRQWDQDVGQTIEVLADCIGVSCFVPNNFVEITPLNENSSSLLRSGLVIDTRVSIAVSRFEQAIGIPTVSYTQNLFVAQGATATIAVPPFATEVLIYQNSLGGASSAWSQFYGDPAVVAGAVEAGQLPFIIGQRRTQQESLIPDVTTLETDADANSDRFFTILWTIRP